MNKTDALIFAVAVVVAVLSRTIYHIAPNVELITALSISAGVLMNNKRVALALPLVMMALTDSIIGNTNIFMFTWSAYLMAPLVGFAILKFSGGKQYFSSVVGAVGFTLFFYLWTNFGVVVLGNMYTNDLPGLMQSYANALPFLKNQLVGNIMFTPAILLALSVVFKPSAIASHKLNTSQQ